MGWLVGFQQSGEDMYVWVDMVVVVADKLGCDVVVVFVVEERKRVQIHVESM